MRLVIQAQLVSIEGKFSEHAKISKVMEKLSDAMYNNIGLVDDSDEDDNLTDISFTYDQDEFTIGQVKKLYNEIKRG